MLNKQAGECLANNQPLSLIMLDFDFFKQYNDTFGHLIGDEVLVSLCKTIRMHIKSTDAVGRWGGEEFVIFLPNTNGTQATQIAQRIRESLAAHKIQSNDHINLPSQHEHGHRSLPHH
jgi:diguanylate cyclase (GGDEF)-like protein